MSFYSAMKFSDNKITVCLAIFIAICTAAIAVEQSASRPSVESRNLRVNVRRILQTSTQGNLEFAKARDQILKLGQAAEPGLIARLAARDPKERSNAVTFLGLLKSRKSIPYLLAKKRDASTDVRIAALEALWCFEDPELIEQTATNYLHDEHPSVRDMAVIVLGRYRHEKAVPYLVSALDDDDKFARECARRGLATFSEEKEPASDREAEKNKFWKDWYKNWLTEKQKETRK